MGTKLRDRTGGEGLITVAEVPVAVRPHGEAPPHALSRFHIPLHVKYAIALIVAAAWTTLAVHLARPWLRDLGELTSPTIALLVISFIAFIPGFMYSFLLTSVLLDKRPPRREIAEYPGVTMLIPAYNEEDDIEETLACVAGLHYDGPLEVLIVNDGSKDDTVGRIRASLATLAHPANFSMRLIDLQKNGGKAAALNRAFFEAGHDLICTIDADSRLRPEALRQIVGRMLSDPVDTEAVAGAVLVSNSRKGLVARTQEWDYFHGIAAVKRMQSMYHGTLVAQGAFSLYRKHAIEAVGGWPETVGEDIALTWGMLKKGFRVGYAEDAIAWTVVPTTLKQFARQRKRWARGLVEALELHDGLLFKPRMTTLFIWWNLLFLPMDLMFSLVFIPGLIAAFFGIFWIVGPMTLAVLPLAALWNIVIFEIQSRMLHRQGLKVRKNYAGLLVYVVIYALVMEPICVWGYASELLRMRKTWETK